MNKYNCFGFFFFFYLGHEVYYDFVLYCRWLLQVFVTPTCTICLRENIRRASLLSLAMRGLVWWRVLDLESPSSNQVRTPTTFTIHYSLFPWIAPACLHVVHWPLVCVVMFLQVIRSFPSSSLNVESAGSVRAQRLTCVSTAGKKPTQIHNAYKTISKQNSQNSRHVQPWMLHLHWSKICPHWKSLRRNACIKWIKGNVNSEFIFPQVQRSICSDVGYHHSLLLPW